MTQSYKEFINEALGMEEWHILFDYKDKSGKTKRSKGYIKAKDEKEAAKKWLKDNTVFKDAEIVKVSPVAGG